MNLNLCAFINFAYALQYDILLVCECEHSPRAPCDKSVKFQFKRHIVQVEGYEIFIMLWHSNGSNININKINSESRYTYTHIYSTRFEKNAKSSKVAGALQQTKKF